MRKLITMMLFGGGALTIISFGDGIAEKYYLQAVLCASALRVVWK